jgi:adenylyltransferase/sulfurtransferase
LLYLTAAGVGTIGILDFDVVDETNLQRQVLFTIEDVGTSKARAAKRRLEKLNPYINFNVHETRLTSDNALEIIKDYDLVADGTDNFPTRYLVNDACVLLGKPNVYASIFRFEGQVSVFNYTNKEGITGPNYRDLFPTPPPPGLVPSCAEGGVIGVLPGIIGSLQANEVIKVISGIGDPLAGRLFLFDALSFETRILKLTKDPENPLTGKNPTLKGLVDYEEFCGLYDIENGKSKVKEVTVHEFKQMIESQHDYQLIDVREPYEFEIVNLGGELIPLNTIENSLEKLRSDKRVIVLCRSGVRSVRAIETLEKKYGFSNLYNLKGGVLAWVNEIDPSLAKY